MFCEPYEQVFYLVFSSSAPPLLYYSHISAIVVSLLLSVFILVNNRKLLAAQILVFLCFTFSAWTVIDLFLWVNIDSGVVMYLWSFWFTIFLLIFFLSFYFLYVFTKKRDVALKYKIIFTALFLPVLFTSASPLNLLKFNILGCNAIENPITIYYVYIVGGLILIWMLAFIIHTLRRIKPEYRRQVVSVSIGVMFFLLSFSFLTFVASIINLFSSTSDTFNIEQAGYIGMVIFIGYLTYAIVEFRAFNVKLLAAQALVGTLVILSASQFLFIKDQTDLTLTTIALVLSIIFGFFLVKSVKKEIAAREKIQKLATDLQTANIRLLELDKQKTEFISFATHQLRSPLTAMKGHASLILEGDLGAVSEPVKGTVETIYASIKTMINIVEDYLNVSRIELGTIKYDLIDMDFKDMLNEVTNEQKTNIESKGLTWSVNVIDREAYKIKADPDKFKQVIMNIIDNSIKYTPTGSLSFSLEKLVAKDAPNAGRPVIRLKVADTGVGIRADVIPKLFQKFSRAPKASEANIHGTGLGLFLARQIMDAHNGRVWAESAGEGRGSQFFVEVGEVK